MVKVSPTTKTTADEFPGGGAININANGALIVTPGNSDHNPIAIYAPTEWRKAEVVKG